MSESAFEKSQIVIDQMATEAASKPPLPDAMLQPSTVRIRFEHDGIDYSVRRDAIYDREVARWMQSDPEAALSKMLGKKKWAEFIKKHTILDEEDGQEYCPIYGDPEADPMPPIMALMKAVNDVLDPTKRSSSSART